MISGPISDGIGVTDDLGPVDDAGPPRTRRLQALLGDDGEFAAVHLIGEPAGFDLHRRMRTASPPGSVMVNDASTSNGPSMPISSSVIRRSGTSSRGVVATTALTQDEVGSVTGIGDQIGIG